MSRTRSDLGIPHSSHDAEYKFEENHLIFQDRYIANLQL